MKKVLSLILSILISFTFSSCSSNYHSKENSDGEVIYKTDVNMPLECGLHENYYDKNDIVIASYYGWDKEN